MRVLCSLVVFWVVTAPMALGGGFGRLEGYVTSSIATDEVRSTMNATYYADIVVCAGTSCRYVMEGSHSIQWSRTGDVLASRNFSVPTYSSRTNLETYAEPGECYFARGDALYRFMAGDIAFGVGVPLLPYDLDYKNWMSPSACRPGTRGTVIISQLCPLVLDLRGDGFATTGMSDPVYFWDMDGDGTAEPSGWSAGGSDDAFLWLDLNDDHFVRPDELFGSAMLQNDGTTYRNGFQALATYDTAAYGGNDDGVIDETDAVWGDLRLWIDINHDAVSQPTEISPLPRHRIVRLGLDRAHDHAVDAAGNSLMLRGTYARRLHGQETEERALVDISFVCNGCGTYVW